MLNFITKIILGGEKGKMSVFRRCCSALGVALIAVLLLAGTALADNVSGDWSYTINADGQAIVTRYLGSQRDVELKWNLDDHMVVEIGEEAFAGNRTIRSIKLPVSVKVIRMNAFKDCAALEEIHLPSRLETIEDGAFLGCTALQTLEIPESVAEIGEGCFETTTVLIGNAGSLAGAYADAMGMNYEEPSNTPVPSSHQPEDDYQYEIRNGGVVITSYIGKEYAVEIPAQIAGYPVRVIGSNAFSSRYEVESVILPEGITEIEKTAFRYCTGLMSIQLPSTLQTIGEYAFFHCENLVEIEIPAGMTAIGSRAFQCCYRLQHVTMSAKMKTIPTNTFFECHSRLTIHAPSGSAAENFAYIKGYRFVSTGK